MTNAYRFHPDTKVYIGPITMEKDLLDGKFLQPGDSTLVAPKFTNSKWDGSKWTAYTPDGPPVEVPGGVVPGPEHFPLTARQLRLGLVRNGLSLSAVQSQIDLLPLPDRDEAQIYWEYSNEIQWNHPMTQALIGMAGIPVELATSIWMIAKDYER